jgi:hypothetical protein
MDAVVERAKPPTGMKNDCAGWQGESWKAGENKDCDQNSRTFGASINEAMINEAMFNDHRTPRSDPITTLRQSQFAGRASVH